MVFSITGLNICFEPVFTYIIEDSVIYLWHHTFLLVQQLLYCYLDVCKRKKQLLIVCLLLWYDAAAYVSNLDFRQFISSIIVYPLSESLIPWASESLSFSSLSLAYL
jgi:hypothetical protein